MNIRIYLLLSFASLILISSSFSLAASPLKKKAEAAERLIGKPEKYAEANKLIAEVLADSAEAIIAENWYISGTLSSDAFNADMRKLSINPTDPSVNVAEMAKRIFSSYKDFSRALALDTLPNAKGKVKPRFAKKIYPRLAEILPHLYTAALRFYSDGNYWPQAYEAFGLCGLQPNESLARHGIKPLPDSIRTKAFFYAGICAYRERHYREAYDAFTTAWDKGMENDAVLSYRIACLEAGIYSDDTNRQTRELIAALAGDGFRRYSDKRFGFLDSAVESLHAINEDEKALAVILEAEEKYPLQPSILALKGWILNGMGRKDEAIEIFRSESILAAPYPAILLEGASEVYKIGMERYAAAKGRSQEARKERKEAREGYLEPALRLAQHALDAARYQGNASLTAQAEDMVAAIQYTLDSLI